MLLGGGVGLADLPQEDCPLLGTPGRSANAARGHLLRAVCAGSNTRDRCRGPADIGDNATELARSLSAAWIFRRKNPVVRPL